MKAEVTSVSKYGQLLLDAPAAITVLDNTMIQRSGLRHLPEILRLAPGLQVVPDEAPLAVRFEKASLMVVDDNETNRSLLKEMLESYEFTIVEARNGKEALAAVKSASPDLILMDMKMPVMDGYEAARALKPDEDFKAIPVIAVSASVMRDSEILVKEAGCDAFLTKPIRTRRLVSELMR
ncbi:MAG: response regulator, partial [Desulfobacterales bacterium]|nr:response regulator [Desulfobacterales bacterium]